MKTPEEFTSMPGVAEIPANLVPGFIYAGVTVYSYGYGEDDGDDLFDAIEESDLWAWSKAEQAEDIVASWAPFIVDLDEVMHVNAHGTESDPECDWCRSTYEAANVDD